MVSSNQRAILAMPVPLGRIVDSNTASVRSDGDYVLYWMTANRRLQSNFSLQRAVEWAVDLQKPLLIFEALRVRYEWASVRFHRFAIQGMADNKAAAAKACVSYFPYVEPVDGAGSGLLQALADKSCVVVTDDFPCFFLPGMVAAVADRLTVKLESVDSNGIYPMRCTDRVFTKAYSFRIHLQKQLTPHLSEFPIRNPLKSKSLVKKNCIPPQILDRWSNADDEFLTASPATLSRLEIDQKVGTALLPGGAVAAKKRLGDFVKRLLHRYADGRNQPNNESSSGLSPYLHFGHISAHEIFRAIATNEEWSVSDLQDVRLAKGSRNGWWNMSPAAESFLDELITWREIGFNACCHDPNYDQYESLPDFARKTLHDHAADPRPYLYSYEDFRDAKTHDEIWNAAQTQLVTEGRMHNYLRMLWGKKILEWTESPRQALQVMLDLNHRYAVDGRDPNSYAGVFWVLGRYDRAWGPERPIFGKIRFMSSESTRKKLKLAGYLARYGAMAGLE